MKIQREPLNPLITCADIPPTSSKLKVCGVFNAAATRFGGNIVLVLRVAETPREQRRDRVPVLRGATTGGKYRVRINTIERNDPKYRVRGNMVWSDEGFRLTNISHLRLAWSKDGVRFKVDPEPFMLPADDTEEGGLEDPRVTRIGTRFYINYSAVSAHGVGTALASTSDFTRKT